MGSQVTTTLTSRELRTLRHLARFRYLHSAQIEALLFDGSPVSPQSRETLCRRVVGSLRQRDLVGTRRRRCGGPGGGSARQVYFLMPAGRRALATATGASYAQLSARGTLFVDHALAIADVAIAFRRSALERPGHRFISWQSDWELSSAFDLAPVRPDGRLVYATPLCGLEAFVELDLDTERPAAFAKKIGRYLDCYRSGRWLDRLPCWPTVLTVTTTVVRAASLRRTTVAGLAAAYEGPALDSFT
ncbi:MAG: hypothetical protein NVS1B1_01970 [Candidatus Limnocylindrales bacterium]